MSTVVDNSTCPERGAVRGAECRFEDLLPVQPDEDSGIVFKLVGNTSSNQINTLEKTE